MRRLLRRILGWGIIGFVLGLVFAPQKGEETREKIKEAVNKGKGKIEEIRGNIKKEEN